MVVTPLSFRLPCSKKIGNIAIYPLITKKRIAREASTVSSSDCEMLRVKINILCFAQGLLMASLSRFLCGCDGQG